MIDNLLQTLSENFVQQMRNTIRRAHRLTFGYLSMLDKKFSVNLIIWLYIVVDWTATLTCIRNPISECSATDFLTLFWGIFVHFLTEEFVWPNETSDPHTPPRLDTSKPHRAQQHQAQWQPHHD